MNDEECPICLDKKEIIRFDYCSHGVCKECKILLEKFAHKKCPLCRTNIGNEDNSTEDIVVRRRRRNLSRIEYIKRRQIIKARQNRSRSKKGGRLAKTHGTNYY